MAEITDLFNNLHYFIIDKNINLKVYYILSNQIYWNNLQTFFYNNINSLKIRNLIGNFYNSRDLNNSLHNDYKNIINEIKTEKNILFIYNENLNQYNDFNDIEKGAGNGIFRIYRSDFGYIPNKNELYKKHNFIRKKTKTTGFPETANWYALGIPTDLRGGESVLTEINKKDEKDKNEYLKEQINIIILSFINILQIIKDEKIDTIFFSCNNEFNIDFSIFDGKPFVQQFSNSEIIITPKHQNRNNTFSYITNNQDDTSDGFPLL